MTDDSRVTKTNARILARQLARPLTDEEIDYVSGGMISRAGIGGAETATRRADTCSGTGCPENDSDA
jgi:hypothetical protein